MFNIARIPKFHCDVLSKPPSRSSPAAHKLLLMIHNWFYTVTVYHPGSEHQLLDVKNIDAQIRNVVLDVEQRLANGEKAVPIGVLSADGRDRWAEVGVLVVPVPCAYQVTFIGHLQNLQYLLSLSAKNQQTHQAILHSLMGLSLENATYTIPPSPSPFPRKSALASPKSSSLAPPQTTLDAHLHTIRSTQHNVSNRFFDKPFTLIVDPSTRAGATGEHSPCDALVPSIVAEWGVVGGVETSAFEEVTDSNTNGNNTVIVNNTNYNGEGWERLEWVVDDKIRKECVEAEERARRIVEDSDDSVLWFEGYGTDWIKHVGECYFCFFLPLRATCSADGLSFHATAKLAPDAYIQMVLQLAWYKTRGEFTATYETVLTRMFKRGRTETLRTLTRDSRLWVLAMVDPNCSVRFAPLAFCLTLTTLPRALPLRHHLPCTALHQYLDQCNHDLH